MVGSVRIGDERRAFVYRDGKMTVHPGFYGLYLVNGINAAELVIGAKYVAKRFEAATMRSNQPAVTTHGGRDLLSLGAAAITVALGVVLYRRRYRGIRVARRRGRWTTCCQECCDLLIRSAGFFAGHRLHSL